MHGQDVLLKKHDKDRPMLILQLYLQSAQTDHPFKTFSAAYINSVQF